MKNLKVFLMALVAMMAFAACENEDGPDDPYCPGPDQPIDPVLTNEVLILNNGNWGANDANILWYDIEKGVEQPRHFFSMNDRQLGDLGQDIAVLENGDVCIAVNGSQMVFVTDKNLRVKQDIVAHDEASGAKLSPRSLCVVGDKVYVTYYEGYLGEINMKDYSVRTTSVGLNPEGLAYVDGKIYVANSGGLNYENGYDRTVSVVDAQSFREEKRIEVNINPQNVVASPDGKTLYVNSFGDYAAIPALLQSISVATDEVRDLEYMDVKGIAAGPAGTLYVATGSYNDLWQVTGTINKYDMAKGTPAGTFVDNAFVNYYSISYSNGLVFVGTSDYVTNGDVHIYDEAGTLLRKIDAQGLNPQKGVRL